MYLIFGGERYYAKGGGYDFLDSKEIFEEAVEAAELYMDREIKYKDRDCDCEEDCFCVTEVIEWVHVLNTKTNKIVCKRGSEPYGLGRQGSLGIGK